LTARRALKGFFLMVFAGMVVAFFLPAGPDIYYHLNPASVEFA